MWTSIYKKEMAILEKSEQEQVPLARLAEITGAAVSAAPLFWYNASCSKGKTIHMTADDAFKRLARQT